jgi:molybdopterin converting factor small subunit
MVVEVRLFATLREGRFNTREVELPEASSLKSLLEGINIRDEEVGILLINGNNARGEHTLTARDVVSIFPPIGGG